MKFNERSYSNKKLEELCNSPKNLGKAVWINHKSEIYGLGKTIRRKFFYSKFLPLCLACDQAVNFYTHIRPSERQINLPYLTWNKKKYLRMKKMGMDVYLTEHPWIKYRKKIFIKKKNANGTIFFYNHSTSSGTKIKFYNLNSLIIKLKKLPKKCQPISICLFHYDIRELKIHKILRKYKINIVTAGHGNCQNFPDNFYNLISNFKYACAAINANYPDLSSSFYYCIEAGVPHFLIKHKFKLLGDGTNPEYFKTFRLKSLIQSEIEKFNKIFRNYEKIKDQVTELDKKIINECMGKNIEANNLLNYIKIIFTLYKSLFFNIKLIMQKYWHGVIKKKLA